MSQQMPSTRIVLKENDASGKEISQKSVLVQLLENNQEVTRKIQQASEMG